MKYILIQWYLQQHGSFSSLGRWRDVSLVEFTAIDELKHYLCQYLENNYPHRSIGDERHDVRVLCQIAVEESNKLLHDHQHEIQRVSSRHIWPTTHKLLMGCLIDEDVSEKNYCLITQLGNRPTHIQFIRGAKALREILFERYKNPFQTTSTSTNEENELFCKKTQDMSTEELCHYVTNRNFSFGVLIDFILEGETLYFSEPHI